ncbi:hypothetical protein RDI58_013060 [Solanum bulbocastanum]
MEEGK